MQPQALVLRHNNGFWQLLVTFLSFSDNHGASPGNISSKTIPRGTLGSQWNPGWVWREPSGCLQHLAPADVTEPTIQRTDWRTMLCCSTLSHDLKHQYPPWAQDRHLTDSLLLQLPDNMLGKTEDGPHAWALATQRGRPWWSSKMAETSWHF